MSTYYHETLPCGGILTIKNNDWYIEYNFTNINPKKGFISVFIKGSEIDSHLNALKSNLELFKDFKKLASSCMPRISGSMNMSINFHGYSKGVCINEFYRPVSNDSTFEKIKNSYIYAKNKAKEILDSKSTY